MLRGSLVTLRAIEPTDFPSVWQWLNDPDLMVYWGRPGNTSSREETLRDEASQAARTNSRKYIVETTDGKTIGQIDFYDLDWVTRSAFVSIMIAERDYWGGGYGTDAMRTLLRYLFLQLGLHRVALNTHETNTRAIRSYEKNGFRVEGTMRDWAFFNGAWVNGVIMSVLAHEFTAVMDESRSAD